MIGGDHCCHGLLFLPACYLSRSTVFLDGSRRETRNFYMERRTTSQLGDQRREKFRVRAYFHDFLGEVPERSTGTWIKWNMRQKQAAVGFGWIGSTLGVGVKGVPIRECGNTSHRSCRRVLLSLPAQAGCWFGFVFLFDGSSPQFFAFRMSHYFLFSFFSPVFVCLAFSCRIDILAAHGEEWRHGR